MKVRLDFTVSNRGLPAIIIIRAMSGELILYKKVYCRQNRLCFCSRSRNLIITVRPFDAGLYEKSFFLKFGCRPCVKLRLDFDFTARASEQVFYLYDENYFFPIPSAELEFFGAERI